MNKAEAADQQEELTQKLKLLIFLSTSNILRSTILVTWKPHLSDDESDNKILQRVKEIGSGVSGRRLSRVPLAALSHITSRWCWAGGAVPVVRFWIAAGEERPGPAVFLSLVGAQSSLPDGRFRCLGSVTVDTNSTVTSSSHQRKWPAEERAAKSVGKVQ